MIWPAEFAKNGFLQDVTGRIARGRYGQGLRRRLVDGEYEASAGACRGSSTPSTSSTTRRCWKRPGSPHRPRPGTELTEQAKIIKDKGIVKFPIVWSWAQAEAIICDYATLVDAYKGSFFEDGKPTFDQRRLARGVKYMEQSLKDGLTNPNSREYLEEDVRKVFSNGDAAFALNWTYMYNIANDPKESKVAGKVGIVRHRASRARARPRPSTARWASASRPTAPMRTRRGNTSPS